MRLAPVMLALLLALSPGAVAVQASAPVAAAAEQSSAVGTSETHHSPVNGNTTSVLTLGAAPDREAFDSPAVSLGRSIAIDREGIRTELSVRSLDRQLEAARNEEQKKQLLTGYRYQIERQIISMKSEEQRARAAFSNGSMSASEFVETLARIDAEAENIHRLVRTMQDYAQETPDFGMPNVHKSTEVQLLTVEGPVRDYVSKSLYGSRDSVRVYVATTETGVVLSMIRGDEYVRETIRFDRRDSSTTESLTVGEAFNTVSEKYPWAKNNTAGGTSSQYSPTDVYDVTLSHNHGNLTAHLDAGTGQIFKEVQHKRLAGEPSLPPGPSVTNTSAETFGGENVTLAVNRTYAGGPLRVELTNETGAPLDGTVTVGTDTVGRTGADGVLWTLGPAEQFRVSATHEGTAVNVTTTPVALSSED